MANSATQSCNSAEGYARVIVNGTPVATLGGPSACTRAATAAAALNSAFAAGDDFEFCTPSWWSDTAPYALVTVKSAKRGNSSTWYKSDKRLIVAATPDDSARPWWSVLVWARSIRDLVDPSTSSLYLPAGDGTANDGSAYTNRKGSNYGCGEPLNRGTANLEVFHCCDLSVAINDGIYSVPDRASRWVNVTYPATGRTAILRVNDVGPASWTGRQIDLTCRGSSKALGIYRTDDPINYRFRT